MPIINMTTRDGITLKTAKKYCEEDITIIPNFGSIYVLSNPVNFVLSADTWNGTIYTLTVSQYGAVGELQIGIPPSSSIVNARLIEQSALTIARIQNNFTDEDDDDVYETYKSTTITIAAANAPTKDITVAIWGLIK